MNERSQRISRLKSDIKSREAYVKAKLGILVPSQIRALRLKSSTPKQQALAKASGTFQSRISRLETPGAANVTLETLAEIAAIHKVGVIVKFVPYSEMLDWDNTYSQDTFDVIRLDDDKAFLNPASFKKDSIVMPETDRIITLKTEEPTRPNTLDPPKPFAEVQL